MIAKGNTLVVDVRDGRRSRRAARSRARCIVRAACWNSAPIRSRPTHDKNFSKDKTVILYCGSGGRAALAGKTAEGSRLRQGLQPRRLQGLGRERRRGRQADRAGDARDASGRASWVLTAEVAIAGKCVDPVELVETRLAPDMLPFRFQVIAVAHHSIGAIEAAQDGVFKPPSGPPDQDYAALQKLVAEARAALHKSSRPKRSTRSRARTSCSRWATSDCRSPRRAS